MLKKRAMNKTVKAVWKANFENERLIAQAQIPKRMEERRGAVRVVEEDKKRESAEASFCLVYITSGWRRAKANAMYETR